MIIESKSSRKGFTLTVKTDDKSATIQEDISTYETPHDVVPIKYTENLMNITVEMLEFNCMTKNDIAKFILDHVPHYIYDEITEIITGEKE